MKVIPYRRGALTYLVIEDMYSAAEEAAIRVELSELLPNSVSPNDPGVYAARDENNNPIKNCASVFLDDFYRNNREDSSILQLNRKLFSPEVTKPAEAASCFFANIRCSTEDSTLVNFYKPGEEYLPHIDTTLLTAVTTFRIGDFTGGELYFPEFDETVECRDNQVVIFPGCVVHHAKTIQADDVAYRISIAQFIMYKKI